jgi:hypothetical protein
MNNKYQYAYHISPGYSLLTIWVICGKSRVRISTRTIKPHADLPRRIKHGFIARELIHLDVPAPLYVPTKGGK